MPDNIDFDDIVGEFDEALDDIVKDTELDGEVGGALTVDDLPPPSEQSPEITSVLRSGAHSRRLEDRVFGASPITEHIRETARAYGVSPWSLLDRELHRTAYFTPPSVMLPGLIGGKASLNLMTSITAPSGGGKGSTDHVFALDHRDGTTVAGADNPLADKAAAPILVPIADPGGPRAPKVESVGSGPALAMLFVRQGYRDDSGSVKLDSGEKVVHTDHSRAMVLHSERAWVAFTEVDKFAALTTGKDTTLDSELRNGWDGTQLCGQTKTNSLWVPPHVYRLCVTVHSQLERLKGVFENQSGGTLQRFLWVSALDPYGTGPLPMSERPHPMTVVHPNWAVSNLTVDERVAQQVFLDRGNTLRGDKVIDPLDAHQNLMRLKLAAAFVIMHGRTEITWRDWEWAGSVLLHSTLIRYAIQGVLRTSAFTAAAERGVLDAERKAAAEVTSVQIRDEIKSAAAVVADYIRREGKAVPKRNLSGRLKHYPKYKAGDGQLRLLTYMSEMGWASVHGVMVEPGDNLATAPTNQRT